MAVASYAGRTWSDYIGDFNRLYPGIRVSVEALSDYSDSAMALLERGNWGEIMMIPPLEKKLYSRYFVPFGTVEDLSRTLRFVDQFAYGGRVYGIASAGNVQGILYNRRVFREAGVIKLPRTPEEFLMVLRLVKLHTKAVPLYTNYAAGWPLDQWDYYISSTATGRDTYLPVAERGATVTGSPDSRFAGSPAGVAVDTSEGTWYVLSGGRFVTATTGSVPAGRCYLLMPNVRSARQLSLSVGGTAIGDATEISDAMRDLQTAQWYDMSGRKLEGMPVRKGVYICNGRKVVIR